MKFSLNASAKKLVSKKEQEKQKQAEEEAAAALAYEDFVKTFDQPEAKVFVKGGDSSDSGTGGTCPHDACQSDLVPGVHHKQLSLPAA